MRSTRRAKVVRIPLGRRRKGIHARELHRSRDSGCDTCVSSRITVRGGRTGGPGRPLVHPPCRMLQGLRQGQSLRQLVHQPGEELPQRARVRVRGGRALRVGQPHVVVPAGVFTEGSDRAGSHPAAPLAWRPRNHRHQRRSARSHLARAPWLLTKPDDHPCERQDSRSALDACLEDRGRSTPQLLWLP
jgi:hypothetical protein